MWFVLFIKWREKCRKRKAHILGANFKLIKCGELGSCPDGEAGLNVLKPNLDEVQLSPNRESDSGDSFTPESTIPVWSSLTNNQKPGTIYVPRSRVHPWRQAQSCIASCVNKQIADAAAKTRFGSEIVRGSPGTPWPKERSLFTYPCQLCPL